MTLAFATYASWFGWTVIEELVPTDEDPGTMRCQLSVSGTAGDRAYCLAVPDEVIDNGYAWPAFMAHAEQGLRSVR